MHSGPSSIKITQSFIGDEESTIVIAVQPTRTDIFLQPRRSPVSDMSSSR